MHKGIRMRNKKVLWGTICILCGCVLVLLFMIVRYEIGQSQQRDQNRDPIRPTTDTNESVIAKIGNRSILSNELQEHLQARYGAEILNQILDREAVKLEADELHVTVTEKEIAQELKRMQAGYEDEEQFYVSMKQQLGLSKQELKDDVTAKLLLERVATYGIQITDEEIDAYVQSHPEEFRTIIQFHLWKIVLASKEEAQFIGNELKAGQPFSELAKQYSLDEGTAMYGGDMGWIDSDDPFVTPIILEAARKMKVNEVSKPLQLEDGYAMIQLTEKKETNPKKDPLLKETLRKELALAKAVPLKDLVRQLREKRGATILDPAYQ